MPRVLRVPLEALAAGVRPLPDLAARYVSRVHRLGPGDRLDLFDPESGLEAAAVLVVGPAAGVWCEVEQPSPSRWRPLPIQLIQGLGKADKPDEVVRAATALGVEAITWVHTERSVARLSSERGSARRQRWRRIAVEAARQSGRGDLPRLDEPGSLEGALGGARAPLRVLLLPGAEPLFARVGAWQGDIELALLVGPEGGFDRRELELAERHGFLPASLGATTLRTELAAVAALGALVALAGARPSQVGP